MTRTSPNASSFDQVDAGLYTLGTDEYDPKYLPSSILTNIPTKLVERDRKTLVVAFPGAVNRSKIKLPYFEWARTLDDRIESYLCVSDPTLNLDGTITLGWFIGNAEVNVHAHTAGLIIEAADRIGAEKIVTIGSSGGGYAALAISAYIPGSVAVAFSPSTAIDRVTEGHTKNLLDAAFPEMSSYEELYERFPERVSLESLYSSTKPNKFFLVQNTGDHSRISRSFEPFADSLGIAHGGGSSPDGLANLILEDHGDGHIPPPKDRFHHWLDVAVSS